MIPVTICVSLADARRRSGLLPAGRPSIAPSVDRSVTPNGPSVGRP